MRNHLLKLSFAVLLGGALAGSACSSSNGQPTGSAGHGGSTVGTAGTSGTAGTTGTGGDGTGGDGAGGSVAGANGGGGAGGGTGGTGGSGTGGTGGATVDPCAGMTAQQCHDMLINKTTTGGVAVTRTAPTVSYPACQ
jgi:hypothetical protein